MYIINSSSIDSFKRKFEKYDHLERNFVFVPVCVETMGTFGSESQKFIKEILGITYILFFDKALAYLLSYTGITTLAS